MKNISFILLSILLFASCELDTDKLVGKDSSNYPGNVKEANEALTGCYIVLAHINPSENPLLVSELLSDERFGGAGDGDYRAHALSVLRKDGENMFADLWNKFYSGIFRCNTLLESFDNIQGWKSDSERDQFLGEVYFMRGYLYSELARFFGTVPLIVETSLANKPRASADEIYAQIASDFNEAIALMPAYKFGSSQAPALGHATKWAAQAMMARVFLFYTGYYNKESLPMVNGSTISKDQVTGYLDDCIANSGHGLVGDFRNLWPYTNDYTTPDYDYAANNGLKWVGESGANNETIFAIKFSSIASWSTSAYYANQVNLYFGIRSQANYHNCFPYGQGWGVGTVNTNLWDIWRLREPNDIRRVGSILNVNDPDENIVLQGDNQDMHVTGFWQKKYMPVNARLADGNIANYSVQMYNRNPDIQLDNTQDIVIVRFADVLLMNAELKRDASYINLVRTRAGLSPIGAYTEEALQYERRFELAFEGLRYHDLLRWGIAGEALTKKNGVEIENRGAKTISNFGDLAKRVQDTGGFMPIPLTQIELSGGVLKQTPGWTGGDSNFN